MDRAPKIRIHFIPEWAERRGMTQADIVRGLQGRADKSVVSRWFAGSTPEDENLLALAGLFELSDVRDLFRHPDADWLQRFLQRRTAEEQDRVRRLLDAAFPDTKAS